MGRNSDKSSDKLSWALMPFPNPTTKPDHPAVVALKGVLEARYMAGESIPQNKDLKSGEYGGEHKASFDFSVFSDDSFGRATRSIKDSLGISIKGTKTTEDSLCCEYCILSFFKNHIHKLIRILPD